MIEQSLKINILGDICLTDTTRNTVTKREPQHLFNGLHEILVNADFNIGNLEAPVPDQKHTPILKTGPALKNDSNLLSILSKTKFKAIGLANNHIRDYGNDAVVNTIDELEKLNIKTFGAGPNKIEAKKPCFVQIGGVTIGLMAFAEHEFNLAGKNVAGANGFDSFESFNEIEEFKTKCDYLVILFHGGVEYHKYPSPLLQKRCRKMVLSGANLILCQHSHCIGAMETYKEGTIVYGQGNSVFGYKDNHPTWNEGLVIELVVTKSTIKLNYIPIKALPCGAIDLMNEFETKECLKEFHNRSKKCSNIKFLEGQWLEFCNSKKSMYLGHLFGFNRYLMFINRKLNNKIIDTLFTKRQKRITQNLLRCESHHEVLKTIFKNEE